MDSRFPHHVEGCICPRFTDIAPSLVADLACPIHGVNGTEPGDKVVEDQVVDVDRLDLKDAEFALKAAAGSEFSARIRPHQAKLLLDELARLRVR
jgi:hypothetical protein